VPYEGRVDPQGQRFDGRWTLAGIVSIGDVVKHRLDELETEANVLRDAFLVRQ
jgi:hypothetical protein